MGFAKCVLAGVGAVIGAVILAALGVAGYLWWFGGSFGIGATAFSLLPILCVFVLTFAAGFWWQWRRAH